MATGFWRSGVTFAVAALIALGGVTAAPGAATNATGGFVMSPVGSADPASGAAAANRGATVYATHSVLISATTAFTTKRIEQQVTPNRKKEEPHETLVCFRPYGHGAAAGRPLAGGERCRLSQR